MKEKRRKDGNVIITRLHSESQAKKIETEKRRKMRLRKGENGDKGIDDEWKAETWRRSETSEVTDRDRQVIGPLVVDGRQRVDEPANRAGPLAPEF